MTVKSKLDRFFHNHFTLVMPVVTVATLATCVQITRLLGDGYHPAPKPAVEKTFGETVSAGFKNRMAHDKQRLAEPPAAYIPLKPIYE